MKRLSLLAASLLGFAATAIAAQAPSPSSVRAPEADDRPLSPATFGAKPDDAVDDSDAFNAMVRQASATGRPIHIPRGVYLLDRPLSIGSNVTIVGQPGATLRAGPNLHDRAMVQSAIFSAGTGHYAQAKISLRGLTFDGGDRPLAGPTFLVMLFSVDGLAIDDCVFQHHGFGLLAIGGGRNIALARDHFQFWGRTAPTHEGGPGLWLAGNAIAGDETPTQTVRAADLDFHDSQWSAIYLFARDAVLRGGTIRNVREAGIYGQGLGHAGRSSPPDSVTTHVEISGYTISHVVRKDVSASGIEIGGDGLSIHDNVIFDTEDAGIKLNWPLHDAAIVHNRIYDTVKGRSESPAWKTVDTYGQITALQWQGSAVDGLVIRANVIGQPGLKPVAAYAIKLHSLGAADHMAAVDISGNDVTQGYAAAPFGFLNTPLVPAQMPASIHDNAGAARAR